MYDPEGDLIGGWNISLPPGHAPSHVQQGPEHDDEPGVTPLFFQPWNQEDEYEVVPVIPIVDADDIVHTADCPFCGDPTCSCHEDPDLIAEVAAQVEAGLLSPQEASDLVKGGGR